MHICSRCENRFDTEEQYLSHNCPATEHAPTDAEHQGEGFALIQQAALERGSERQE